MIAELGAVLAAVALIASLAQAGFGLRAGARSDSALAAIAASSAQTAAFAALMAFALLITLFVQSDFSVAVVQANSHIDKPLLYKIAGTWGNHEGSMLLWCLVSAFFGLAMAHNRGAMGLGMWARAIGVQGAVTAGALIYTLILSNPFARLDPAPYAGSGLNPLLQDPALAAHPPMLYLGYVGLSAPFSLAIAALLEGKANQGWARALRPWALIAWTCLTFGIGLGSYWAYYELGWGGWWFWDPVENASFMPWLAACALVHCAIVTERRGSLASWTILLSIIAFGLALLGTFLVRSGVLTSVHAFAVDPRRGVAVLALLAVVLGVGFGLYAWRAPGLAKPAGFAAVSREGLMVFNNLGLAVAAGAVLVGTLYPIAVEAATGDLISVGPPYFNIAFAPLMAALFLVMPLAPLLTWRKGDAGAALRTLWLAGALAFASAAIVLLFRNNAIIPAAGIGIGVWATAGAFVYLWKRWGQGGPRSAARFAALPLSVWALAAAHIGAGVLTIGAVAETAFRSERAAALAPGESITFAGRTATLLEVAEAQGPNYTALRATLRVAHGGRVDVAAAERRAYSTGGAPTTEVAILSALDGDFYIALGEAAARDGQAAWTIRFYHNPLVQLIFWGVTLMGLGGALGLAALARRRRTAPHSALAAA
ncbi:MAG: heme lyase CcmF/NrfE family subunit [Hyphomonadaceae bacterium]|nr:heme lyase CcmF/NrfE family subunit [Hyphomonadaceae bacterium]